MEVSPARFAFLVAGMALRRVGACAKKTLLVAEPTHGVGYLPLYVAIRTATSASSVST